jgi:hypothetical protein
MTGGRFLARLELIWVPLPLGKVGAYRRALREIWRLFEEADHAMAGDINRRIGDGAAHDQGQGQQ